MRHTVRQLAASEWYKPISACAKAIELVKGSANPVETGLGH
jgi:uncharacterized protein YegP (UPF0339 family)